MITKIAGTKDFERISKEKQNDTIEKNAAKKAKKVITENNISPQNKQSKNAPQKTFAMYMAELYGKVPQNSKTTQEKD